MNSFSIINPFTQKEIGSFDFTSKEETLKKIETLDSKDFNNLPTIFERSKIIEKLIELTQKNSEELALLISKEMGKTLGNARGEISRGILAMQVGVDLMRSHNSELLSTENYSSNRDDVRWGLVHRVPYGVILAIVPFNFPINLAIHKLIPSFAMGNSTLIKPHPQCYLSSKFFIDLCLEAGMTDQDIALICPSNEDFSSILNHEAIKIVSFTGGNKTADIISKQLVYKKHLFELGCCSNCF